MLKLMGKAIFTILRSRILFIKIYDIYIKNYHICLVNFLHACMLILHVFFCCLQILKKIYICKKEIFRNTIRVANIWDPDQARLFVRLISMQIFTFGQTRSVVQLEVTQIN